MADLVVGCPVAHRAWIFDAWFDAVEESCERAGLSPAYAFVCDEGDECVEIIERRADTFALELVPPAKGTDQRVWNPRRFAYMVILRNQILQLAASLEPRWFLSLDSDVLAHPELVANLVETLAFSDFDAVGGKCYMTEVGTRFPSWGRIGKSGSLQRYNATGVFPVHVIMAIKLLSPRALQVPYEPDLQGEDVGWSKACTRNGLRLGWDGRVTSKHVLSRQMLGRLDARAGC